MFTHLFDLHFDHFSPIYNLALKLLIADEDKVPKMYLIAGCFSVPCPVQNRSQSQSMCFPTQEIALFLR